jgi:hypothetical protein
MNVPHYIIVEPDQISDYQEAINKWELKSTIIPLDLDYKSMYELCDDLGLSKSTGPGPARNFAWDHSIAYGHEWHWVMDDNISNFARFNHNLKIPCQASTFFDACEDFTIRYENVVMSGPNYTMFCLRKKGNLPPFTINTRIYSCNLIKNDIPFRWRGRYNEDSILSIDILKAGLCTIQFNSLLQNKISTQIMKGGNSEDFYFKEGTVAKSKMLVDVHPDVSELVYKFSRWHHTVNYNGFKRNNLLKFRPGFVLPTEPNNYGMKLIQVKEETK